jgi:hypothetical protein
MVPLGSLVSVSRRLRARSGDALQRLSRRGDQRRPAPGFSSGQAQAAIAGILDAQLPAGMSFEWTELAYQELLAGNTMLLIFPLCVLLVYIVLAAPLRELDAADQRHPHRPDGACSRPSPASGSRAVTTTCSRRSASWFSRGWRARTRF